MQQDIFYKEFQKYNKVRDHKRNGGTEGNVFYFEYYFKLLKAGRYQVLPKDWYLKTEDHRRFRQMSVLLINDFPPTSTKGSHCSAETLRPWNCLSVTHWRLPTTSAEAPNTSQVRHRPAHDGLRLLLAALRRAPDGHTSPHSSPGGLNEENGHNGIGLNTNFQDQKILNKPPRKV